jgi:outer membrane protein assembly factor BamA
VRSLLVLLPVAALGGWAVIRHLPAKAEAEPTHATVTRTKAIESISIDGRNLPMASLRELLTTHVGEQVDSAKLDHDRAALEQALVERGFYAAHVNAPHVSHNDGGDAFVTFRIEQGPQFRVRSVIVTGANAKDAGVVALEAGEIASADRIQFARTTLADRLESRGKRMNVAANVREDASASVVDIELVAAH